MDLEKNITSYSTRQRSRSLGTATASKPKKSFKESTLYPFTEKEKVRLWNGEINKYESDLSLDPEDQLLLEQLSLEDVGEFQHYLKYTLHENTRLETEASDIVDQLDEMLRICDKVTMQTMDFQARSNELILEVDQLNALKEDLSDKLSYFEPLEPIVQTLNTSSSGSIVTRRDFQENILGKLDQYIAFVSDPDNANYKEAKIYKFRYKQCMVRALTLVSNYVNSAIRKEEQSVQAKIDEQTSKDANLESASSRIIIDAVLSEKFADDLQTTSDLFRELYKRAVAANSDDYFGLLNDSYDQYTQSRSNLLDRVTKPYSTIRGDTTTNQKVQLALATYNKLLEREAYLFQKLFFLKEDELTQDVDNGPNVMAMNHFFEQLTDPLYEYLRASIIRENNIGILCETIGIIESYFEYDDETASLSHINGFGGRSIRSTIDYPKLLRPILEDAQTRLVFRVRRYIDQNVVNYKKTGKELAIGARKGPAKRDPEFDTDDKSSIASLSLLPETEGSIDTTKLYPPVVKSVRLLSKIYQLVSPAVFDDLANSIVHLAIQSLKTSFDNDVSLESRLYEIRNLMFLKDYMAAFEIESSSKETSLDFSGLKDLYDIIFRRNQGAQDIRGIFADRDTNPFFAAVPKVKTDFFNCKAEIQATLRDAVHSFIDSSKQVFIQPLDDYPEKTDLETTTNNFMDTIHQELPRLGPRIHEYVKDQQTIFYLVDGVQNEVVEAYEEFYSKASNEKSDQVEKLLDLETVLTEWGNTASDMLANMDSESDDEALLDSNSSSEPETDTPSLATTSQV